MGLQRTIRDLYENEGKTLEEIMRITGRSWRTVKKYATKEDFRPKDEMAIEPEDFPVLGDYIKTIDIWLENDTRESRVQRHTVKRVYDRLKAECGYTGGYGSVKAYVRRKRRLMGQVREGFVPLAHPPGQAQVDFGDADYYDACNMKHRGHELVVSFPYSNAGWIQLFPAENQECLFEGLVRIFMHINGVPNRGRFDNMSTAVVTVLKGIERVTTEGFDRFRLHHRFAAEFCNPDSGNEKGSVENKVGFERRNLLVPVPVIEDFDAYNKELLKRCDALNNRPHYVKKTEISALFEEESAYLLALPKEPYEVYKYKQAVVGKTGKVRIEKKDYGLSPDYAGRKVIAKIYFDKVEFIYDNEIIKTYARIYGAATEVSDWREYLHILARKPRAAINMKYFGQLPKLWQEHLRKLEGNGGETKRAILLLAEIVGDGNESLADDAVEMAYERIHENETAGADSIRQCYYLVSMKERHPREITLISDHPKYKFEPDLSAYDALSANGGETE